MFAPPGLNPSWYLLQVAEDLRQRILALYDRHLAPDGRSVDYAALGADPAFAAFCTAAAELQVQHF